MDFGLNEYGLSLFGDSDKTVSSEVQSTAVVSGSANTRSLAVAGGVEFQSVLAGSVTEKQRVTSAAIEQGSVLTSSITQSLDVVSAAVSSGTAISSTVILPTFYTERPDLVESVVHEGRIDQRERLEGYLKAPFQSPFDSEGGFKDDEFGHFVAAAAEFAQGMRYMQEEFLRQQFVDTARYSGLDEIGDFVGIYRRTDEGDPSYRARIKAGFRGLLGGATLEKVITITAQLLSCGVDEIDIVEPFALDSARMDLTIPTYVLNRAPVSREGMIELIYVYRAAGIEITLAVGDVFTYRSLADAFEDPEVNDPDQAYAQAPYRSSPR